VLEDFVGVSMTKRPSELIQEVLEGFMKEEGDIPIPEIKGFCSRDDFSKAFERVAESFDWDKAFEKGEEIMTREFVEHVREHIQAEVLTVMAERPSHS